MNGVACRGKVLPMRGWHLLQLPRHDLGKVEPQSLTGDSIRTAGRPLRRAVCEWSGSTWRRWQWKVTVEVHGVSKQVDAVTKQES